MDEVLAGTVLFQGLPSDAAERLSTIARCREIERGAMIFRQGEPGASMYVILRGKVRVTRPADPGRDNLLTLLGPGDLFGELTLFDPAPRKATATAITDVEIAEFTASAMKEWLAAEPEAAWHFLRLLARRLRRVNDTLENLLFGDVPRRVARTLLDMAERFGDPVTDGVRVHHDLTQEQLAQHVGASRESVNKALSELAARSIVRLEPKTVVILDIERLRRKSGSAVLTDGKTRIGAPEIHQRADVELMRAVEDQADHDSVIAPINDLVKLAFGMGDGTFAENGQPVLSGGPLDAGEFVARGTREAGREAVTVGREHVDHEPPACPQGGQCLRAEPHAGQQQRRLTGQ